VKLTGSQELAVAIRLTGTAVLIACVGMAVKLIVWAASVTVKLCVTDGAAAYSAFHDWTAWMLQVPAAAIVTAAPDIVQTAGVVEIKLTGRPELAVAVNGSVELTDSPGIAPKLIVCCVLPIPMPLNEML
jgi:hypothetical protein